MNKLKIIYKAGILLLLGLAISGILMPATATAAGYTAKGYVKDIVTQVPMAGVTITLRPTVYAYGTHNYVTTTNANGYYEINNVMAKTYTSGGTSRWVNYIISASYPEYTTFNSQIFTFQYSTTKVSNIQLAPTGGEVKGAVYNSAGQALSGITITLKPNAYGYGARDYTTVTDANGRYDIRGILRAICTSGGTTIWLKYKVYISAAGYNDYVSTEINFQNYYVITNNVTLNSVGLPSLSGIVSSSANGRPLAGVVVLLKPSAYGYGTHDYQVTTNANGYYEINNILGGVYSSGGTLYPVKYKVYVSCQGFNNYVSQEMTFTSILAYRHNVSLLPRSTPAISGFIEDSATALPISGAIVTLKPAVYAYGTHDYVTTTNANGYYEFNDILKAVYSSGGTLYWVNYTLSVSAAGYKNYLSSQFNFSSQSTFSRDVTLSK